MKAIWLKPRKAFKIKKAVKTAYKKYSLSTTSDNVIQIKSPKYWGKKLNKFALAQPNDLETAVGFFTSVIIKRKEVAISEDNPILICIVKDDLYRMKKFLLHYRGLGVKNFAILDNMSTDGTYEFLMQEPGINVFQISEPYSTERREAWINRMLAYYGFNRWYIVVDSDELLSYPKMEKHNINDLITYAKLNNRIRMRAMMVDMYPYGNILDYKNDIDYYEQCCYFDDDSYYFVRSDYSDGINGGPRGRIFGEKAFLTKYPVFFLRKKDMEAKSHYLFPYLDNKNVPCELALLHYKFLPGDLEKYRERAESGLYFNGSQQYKNYIKTIESQSNLVAYSKNSRKYISSDSLQYISIIENINWENER